MNEKRYNILRLAAQVWIPAAGTMIFTFGSIWGWGFTENVVGSLMAFDTFLGVLLSSLGKKFSTAGKPYDGEITVNTDDPSRDLYTLDLGKNLADLQNRTSVHLKIIPPPPQPKEPQEKHGV